MALIDMAYDAAEAEEEAAELERPKYPWGLNLYLNEEVLEKLGMTREDFEVGGSMLMTARVRVTGINEREYEGSDPSCCIDLQIQKMELKSAPAETPKGKDTLGGRMYG